MAKKIKTSGETESMSIPEQFQLYIAPMQQLLESLKDTVLQADRALRGNNGTVGVIARVTSLEEAVERLGRSVDELIEKVDKVLEKQEKDTAKTEKADTIDFKWVVEKFALPIGITLLTYFMIQIVPQILILLGNK